VMGAQACAEQLVLLSETDFSIVTEDLHSGRVVCASYPEGEVGVSVSGEDGNYLLYTSGSTGVPKIISGSHKGLSHFIHWEVKEFGLGTCSRVSQLVPLSFDVSLRDIYTPLLSGGTLCIPAAGMRGHPVKLLEWISRSGVTLIHTVPSLFRLLTRELEQDSRLPASLEGLKHILLSGEALYGKDVVSWRRAAGPGTELVNLYGPTETTLAKIYNRIGDDAGDPGGIVPLGIPLPNTSIIICTGDTQSKIGAIGEIYIKTPFRSRGYYGDAALTLSSFIQNPLHNDYEDIVYRTGDLGKYQADRSIAFVGRQDSQVKIRGNRVELSETERVMHGYPGIDQVVVLALRRPDESDVLAAYYVCSSGVDHDALRAYLKGYLPDYMHPSYYLQLEEFPLNLNGKVNKKALPRPEELLYEKTAYEAPAGRVEEGLAAIWSSVLRLGKVGANNSFFDLGGHSLTATRAVSRIYKELGVEISLKDFFEHPTIRQLSAFLSGRVQADYRGISLLGEQEDYELSHAQKLLWVLDQSSSGMVAYNMPASCLLHGRLDKAAFSRAFDTLISRHEILRTTFRVVSGEPRQQVHDQVAFKLHQEDARGLLSAGGPRDVLIGRYAESAFREPFNLQTGPLLRARLVQLGEEEHLLLFTMHHIISDGWSMGILVKEIRELYSAYSRGLAANLGALKVQYKDYAAWHNRQLTGAGLQASRAYWHGKLSGELPVMNLPADHARTAVRSYAGGKLRFSLSRSESDRIRELCSQQEVSLFMFFLTAVNILLYKQTGQKDTVVGTTIVSRNNPDLEGLIGMFLNSMVLRNEISQKDDFVTALKKVKVTVLEAYENQAYPVELLLNELNIQKTGNRNPLYDVLVVFNNAGLMESAGEEQEDGLSIEEIDLNEGISKFDLTFFINDDPQLGINLEYSTELFDVRTIHQMGAELLKLVRFVVNDQGQTINKLLWTISGKQLEVANNINNLISEEF